MKDIHTLLFEDHFNGRVLFKNQQDIVISLLNDPDTYYYVDKTNLDQYNKSQTRLKTYISQLLSSTANRSITEDLESGLLQIISKKLNNKEQADSIVKTIVKLLKEHNSGYNKQEVKNNFVDQFSNDFYSGNYIVIINSNPIEVEANFETEYFSLRNVFFQDFFDCLENDKPIKHYRFNFPLRSSAEIFWIGIQKVFIKHLNEKNDSKLLVKLHNRFVVKVVSNTSTVQTLNFDMQRIEKLVNEILEYLNRIRLLMVFVIDAPIFSLPTIAINPAGGKGFKLYSLFDKENAEIEVYKYSETQSVLWRLFLWDRLKSHHYNGKEIKFLEALSLSN